MCPPDGQHGQRQDQQPQQLGQQHAAHQLPAFAFLLRHRYGAQLTAVVINAPDFLVVQAGDITGKAGARRELHAVGVGHQCAGLFIPDGDGLMVGVFFVLHIGTAVLQLWQRVVQLAGKQLLLFVVQLGHFVVCQQAHQQAGQQPQRGDGFQ